MLDADAWRPTRDTLHRWLQMAGKVRMALVAPQPDWGHVMLAVSARGLTTGPLRAGERDVELAFDLVAHRLEVRCGGAAADGFELRDGLSCADFHRRLFGALGELGVHVAIRAEPFGLDGPPFAQDTMRRGYDAGAAERFWRILRATRRALDELTAEPAGASPVGLHWHRLDLAQTRRSDATAVTLGFRPGGGPRTPQPVLYGSIAPAPEGLTEAPLEGEGAVWREAARGPEALAPYRALRRTGDPLRAAIVFYESVLRTAGWRAGCACGR